MMLDISYAVEYGVSHIEVSGGEVDLRSQSVLAFLEFAVLHSLEQIEILFDRPVSPW